MRLSKQHPGERYQWWVVTTLALQAHEANVCAQLARPAASPPHGDTNGAACSTDSQPPAGLGADKLLQLAEAMAGRLLAKPPASGQQHHSWEEVMMFLGLLQAQVRVLWAVKFVCW
jgi:hypothetical protein